MKDNMKDNGYSFFSTWWIYWRIGINWNDKRNNNYSQKENWKKKIKGIRRYYIKRKTCDNNSTNNKKFKNDEFFLNLKLFTR